MDKVSIITPCYNSSCYIGDAIDSVMIQTYTHWEMIIIDDCSLDHTCEVVDTYVKQDSRIRLVKSTKNSGSAAVPRNMGIELATGRYIAFLDSDDIWLSKKLEEQIGLFMNDSVAIVFSNYRRISKSGEQYNSTVVAPAERTYNQLLKSNSIGCLTAVYDTRKCGKLYFKAIGHEDYALWLSILKQGFIAQNTNTINALYRMRSNSLSANKMKAIFWTWNIYRNIENINVFKSLYYLINHLIKAMLK